MLFCSYEICDYKSLDSFSSYKRWMSDSRRKYTDKELYRMWYSAYNMK